MKISETRIIKEKKKRLLISNDPFPVLLFKQEQLLKELKRKFPCCLRRWTYLKMSQSLRDNAICGAASQIFHDSMILSFCFIQYLMMRSQHPDGSVKLWFVFELFPSLCVVVLSLPTSCVYCSNVFMSYIQKDDEYKKSLNQKKEKNFLLLVVHLRSSNCFICWSFFGQVVGKLRQAWSLTWKMFLLPPLLRALTPIRQC